MADRKITQIHRQGWSTLLNTFLVCPACNIVDTDWDRIRVGHPCSNCGSPSEAGRIFLPTKVDVLMDMMQAFHFAPGTREEEEPGRPPRGSLLPCDGRDFPLMIVILYCTLGEVLLQHFLRTLMDHQGLSDSVQKILLDEHQYTRKRVEKLFPALTGEKWKLALKKLSSEPECELDFVEVHNFYVRTATARNAFLHEGSKWVISSDMPEHCVEQTWPLVSLFVALHNEYIADGTIALTR